MPYDGAEINAHWGNAWPAGNDPTDPNHEFSPLLEAPVANLLGEPWYIESGSPGGDHVLWLNVKGGGRVGVSPHVVSDGLVHWVIGFNDPMGCPMEQDSELLISATPQEVADRVKSLMAQHEVEASTAANDGPTKLGMADELDYLDPFNFNKDFPIPDSYVVAYGMAHFRGPDGYLWFAPDSGSGNPGEIEWAYPQNVAEFDQRHDDPERAQHGPNYEAVMATISRLVDEALAATKAYTADIPAEPDSSCRCSC